MPTAVQRRGGTAAEIAAVALAAREIVINTDRNTIHVMDGATNGGFELALADASNITAFVGDSGSGGTQGLVPAPSAGDAAADKFMHADGTWQTPPSATVASVFGRAGVVTAQAGDYDEDDITAPASATNYTPTAATVAGHLDGIDTAIGSKQAADATLTALAGLATAADRMIYATGADTFQVTPITSLARQLLDDADAAAMRTTIGARGLADDNTWTGSNTFDGAFTSTGIDDNATSTQVTVNDTGVGVGAAPTTSFSLGSIGAVKEMSLGLSNTLVRFRERNATDEFAISTNINDGGTQDDATKSSWYAAMGYGAGGDRFAIARSPVGSSVFDTKFLIDGSGNVGIGGAPSYPLDVHGNVASTQRIRNYNASTSVGSVAALDLQAGSRGMLLQVNFASQYTHEQVSGLTARYTDYDTHNWRTSGGANNMVLGSTGSFQLNQYGSGSKTGTAAYSLAVDSSGNVIEESVGGWTYATSQATTSGTAIDFTGIPAGVSEIIVGLSSVSFNASDGLLIQLGDAGGVETTGYTAAARAGGSDVSSTAGFVCLLNSAANSTSGAVHLSLVDSASETWVANFSGNLTGSNGASGGGIKTLSAALDRVRLTATAGATFDNGTAYLKYR